MRYHVTAEVKAARKNQIEQAKRAGNSQPAVLGNGKIPFINVFHPSQITDPHLVTFVRQQAQKKKSKRVLGSRNELEAAEDVELSAEIENFASTPEGQMALAKMFAGGINPVRSHVSQSNAM